MCDVIKWKSANDNVLVQTEKYLIHSLSNIDVGNVLWNSVLLNMGCIFEQPVI